MNVEILKNILSKEDHRDELLSFLLDNHMAITRKSYSNQNYDNNLL